MQATIRDSILLHRLYLQPRLTDFFDKTNKTKPTGVRRAIGVAIQELDGQLEMLPYFYHMFPMTVEKELTNPYNELIVAIR